MAAIALPRVTTRLARALLLALFASIAGAQEAPERATGMGMAGLYGPYGFTRDGSGTSWQPDSTPMDGLHAMSRGWLGMVHGFIDAIYDEQGGPRGASKSFST